MITETAVGVAFQIVELLHRILVGRTETIKPVTVNKGSPHGTCRILRNTSAVAADANSRDVLYIDVNRRLVGDKEQRGKREAASALERRIDATDVRYLGFKPKISFEANSFRITRRRSDYD